MKISEIAKVVGGKLFPEGGGDAEVRDILIDSRRLIRPEETMFVAVVTPRNDGHQYIQELYDKGVRLFLVSKDCYNQNGDETSISHKPPWVQRSKPQRRCEDASEITIIVPDTLAALQALAAFHRRSFDIPVIGITGSNGKTIVKEWLYQLLAPEYNIIRSPKSYNSQIGVPLSVWKMEKEHQLAVFEAGISMPGEMEKLEEIVRPDYGIITNIGHAHDEHFKSTIQKTDEKLRLFKRSKVVVYCSDYDLIDTCVKLCDPDRTYIPFSWSRSKPADLEVKSVTREPGSVARTVVNVLYKGKDMSFAIPFTDDASIENAIHCFAMCLVLAEYEPGARDHEAGILERFSSLAPIAMRLELKDAINHCSLINDSYNSDINSLGIALDFLIQQNQHTKKTVILSDILQSGRDKNDLYNEISSLLESKDISKLIGIGRDMNKYSDKFKMQKTFFYTTDDFLMHYPVSSFQDESILLKGARLFEFERISNALQQKAHETVLEINLDAMVHNLNYYRSLLKPGVKVMAMVKAFSYGSGSYEIANLLQYHRADYLAVAYADEGVELRKAGIHLPIMVMSPEEHSLDTLLKYNLEPEIYNMQILDQLIEAVKRNQTSNQEAVRVHIKLDTGMHRLGFQEDEVDELIKRLVGGKDIEAKQFAQAALGAAQQTPAAVQDCERKRRCEDASGITVVSVFSHLAASEDEREDAFTVNQIGSFERMGSRIITAIGYPVLQHILNSAGISRFPSAQFDMVRLGIGLYGVGANEGEQLQMRNVSTLRTIIIQLKNIKKGETIGYNRKGKAGEDCSIAVIPIGYADGLDRRLGNGNGKVFINGNAAPLIGNVCMDLAMADVTGLDVKEGDEVVIFDDTHPLAELAKAAGTIPYEIMTGISRRVKRIYYHE
ncbi:MAG: bifunctional UDP-N-acetylmuramoyl-tripeptide:D-alanyl-D-alanine ligase/alanine racemase [Bacteroidota bacterium]